MRQELTCDLGSNLSLSVGGFDEGISGNMGIGAFLVKGEEAQSLKRISREGSTEALPSKPLEKHRKLEKEGIHRFFSKPTSIENHDDEKGPLNPATGLQSGGGTSHRHIGNSILGWEPADLVAQREASSDSQLQEPISYLCHRCSMSFEDSEQLQCHQDEHLARDLQEEERGSHTFVGHPSSKGDNKGTAASAKRPTKRKKMEVGQSKLKFG